jgi:hypothetical protein
MTDILKGVRLAAAQKENTIGNQPGSFYYSHRASERYGIQTKKNTTNRKPTLIPGLENPCRKS